MGRAAQTNVKSSSSDKPKDPATRDLSPKRKERTKGKKSTGGRTMLSQCQTEHHRLFQRVAKKMKAESEGGKLISLSKKALEHFCFLTQALEQPLFSQCRQLMQTRTMSSKLLTTSMFLCWDKDVAQKASAQAARNCYLMRQMDNQLEESKSV